MRLGASLAAAVLLAGCRPPKPVVQAPEITLERLLQAPKEPLSLSELRGNVVVLDFWATWCKPCVETLPHMNKMVDAFQGRPVRFISITDEPAAVVETFMRTHPMRAWIGLDPWGKAFEAFGVRGRPEVFIIDPYGRIYMRINPSFLYKSDIAKAMKARPPEP